MKRSKRLKIFLFIITLVFTILLSSMSIYALEYSSIHIVESGDSICGLALVYSTTPDDILKINNIENPNLIYPGQEIYIPLDRSNYLNGGWSFDEAHQSGYKRGDIDYIDDYEFVDDNNAVGLWRNVGICDTIQEFDCNIDQQISYFENNPEFNITFAEYGDIKNGGDFAWSSGTFYNYSGRGENISYLIKIIENYKYMFLEYNENNNIFYDDNLISEDVKYYVFKKYENIHIVHRGETLNQIAKAYGTTVEKLADINDIEDINMIYVFQKLKIPYN